MTQPKKPWEYDEGRRGVPFSGLPQNERDAMKARLAITLAELRSAVPANERLRRGPAAAERAAPKIPQEQSA